MTKILIIKKIRSSNKKKIDDSVIPTIWDFIFFLYQLLFYNNKILEEIYTDNNIKWLKTSLRERFTSQTPLIFSIFGGEGGMGHILVYNLVRCRQLLHIKRIFLFFKYVFMIFAVPKSKINSFNYPNRNTKFKLFFVHRII